MMSCGGSASNTACKSPCAPKPSQTASQEWRCGGESKRLRIQRYRRSYRDTNKRIGALVTRTAVILILWNHLVQGTRWSVCAKRVWKSHENTYLGVIKGLSGNRINKASTFKGGRYANKESDFTPSNVSTALRN